MLITDLAVTLHVCKSMIFYYIIFNNVTMKRKQ